MNEPQNHLIEEEPPVFVHQVPEPLLSKADEMNKYLLIRTSIMEQQNQWLIRRTIADRRRLDIAEQEQCNFDKRIKTFERLRDRFTWKWSVPSFLGGVAVVLVAPIIVYVAGEWLWHSVKAMLK